MLTLEQRFMIKDLYRQGVSISEIARQIGHDRKTIRSAIQAPLTVTPKARAPKARKLDPYVPYLQARLALGVYNAHKLYQELLSLGYCGKERQVRAFVQPLRPARQPQATVRFETEPGRQAQVDWAAFGTIVHHGHSHRLYAFLMTLSWSRMSYLEFTVATDITWWLRCHLHAFAYFGGVPQEVLHDNLKTAVLHHPASGSIHWHPRYLDFAHSYGFRPRACRPYRAQTKGKVERGIRYVRHNFWPGLVFADLADLNQQARHWLDTVANVRLHATTQAVPLERLSQEGLQPIAGKPPYDTSLISYRRSRKDCLVSYGGNAYSVPAAFAQQSLILKETEAGELHILSLAGEEVARHPLLPGRHQQSVQPGHYAHLPPPKRTPQRTAYQLPAATVTLGWAVPEVEVRPLAHYEQWAVAPQEWVP
jgi:transposase